MSVLIDNNAGFCFGVVNAINTALLQLDEDHSLYCLGDIVHNNEEVSRLANKGLRVIDSNQMASLHDTKVLIRAHGEPPETYRLAHRCRIQLIDATCPIVLALQKKVKSGYESMKAVGGQVVIFGKKGHAEVVGLNGQTDNTAIIVSSPSDILAIDLHRPIRLYSQTTQSLEDYNLLINNIQSKLPPPSDSKNSSLPTFIAYNTICSRMIHRASQLRNFASQCNLVIFVSGGNSSNGRYLFDYCRQVQPNTIFISSPNELKHSYFVDYNPQFTIGITGATSTPLWLMEQVKQRIESDFLPLN